MSTCVVLRAIGLGDMVTGLPALALLRARLPGWRVVLGAPGRFAEVLGGSGLVDAVVPVEDLAHVTGLPARPHLAVDLHGDGPASKDPLLALRPDRCVGFAPTPAPDRSRWDDDEHEVDRWCRLVAEQVGGPATPPPLPGLLPVPPPVRPGSTVVHPGAASGSRRWPARRWAAVAAALRDAGHRVVVTGTAEERSLVDEVADGGPGLVDLSVGELCGLVAAAHLVLSGDTGTAHVAAVFGTPSVVLSGPVSPRRWGPPVHPRHRVLWPADDPGHRGDPHGTEVDPVLLRTSVPDVLAAAAEVAP
ncbi:glycosyltransferase family 9 protein [Klenkia sp. LSe6-5]|uniref:Glycosyltransferase family 9 protein n=1 Tax=Klenkia sesuvii TaxID=3103137 RepID=A0ABU8DZB6_9ACTN